MSEQRAESVSQAGSTARPMAVVLAAGLGTRMRSAVSKVLHPLCGRPMVAWVVAAAQEAGCDAVAVVHHQEADVRAALPGLRCLRQERPRGTGDAVRAAVDALPATGTVIVLPGDAPLVTPAILRSLVQAHGDALCTVLSTQVEEPGAYGRVLRQGDLVRVVEAAEASPEELAIREVNTGIYAFEAAWLRDEVLPGLRPHPPKQEYYITDAVELAARQGRLRALCRPESDCLRGINDRWALAEAEDLLQARILRAHAEAGVGLRRPGTIRVEAEVELGRDVLLEPGVVLEGRCRVGAGASVGAYAVLRDTVVDPGARILPHCVLQDARVGAQAQVGPFSHLRPKAQLGEKSRVGNFVEVKNSVLAEGVKASHLSYLGDADIGRGTNVGAGTITCNYDGYQKHRTVIGERVFVGSNTALVAPVKVGDRALIGAGSTITSYVPVDALAVERCRQVIYPDGARHTRQNYRERAGLPREEEE